jgi:hypothetical protein
MPCASRFSDMLVSLPFTESRSIVITAEVLYSLQSGNARVSDQNFNVFQLGAAA